MHQQEEWRPIPGLPSYEASSEGRIRSTRNGVTTTHAGRTGTNGYRYVDVRTGGHGSYRVRTVHSLVAEAFHGPRPDGYETRHLDGTRTNNAAQNLRWGTPSENRYDSVRHGTHHMVRRARAGERAA